MVKEPLPQPWAEPLTLHYITESLVMPLLFRVFCHLQLNHIPFCFIKNAVFALLHVLLLQFIRSSRVK